VTSQMRVQMAGERAGWLSQCRYGHDGFCLAKKASSATSQSLRAVAGDCVSNETARAE